MVTLIAHASMPSLASKLGVLPGLRWFFNLHPIAFFAVLELTWLVMPANDYAFVWGHFLPLSYQWLSALFDHLLFVAAMLMQGQLKKAGFDWLSKGFRTLLSSWRVHLIVVICWTGFSVSHMLAELPSLESPWQWTGFNSLWHNAVLVPFYGYTYTLLLVVCWMFLMRVSREHISRRVVKIGAVGLIGLICAAAWIAAGKFDGTHQYVPNGDRKISYTSPADPYCGGKLSFLIPWCDDKPHR